MSSGRVVFDCVGVGVVWPACCLFRLDELSHLSVHTFWFTCQVQKCELSKSLEWEFALACVLCLHH